MKSHNDFTQENVTKSMLEIILEKESFDDIIKYIVSLSRIEDEDINIKRNFPYSTFDKLAMIKKYTGSINLLQCLMEVYAKKRKASENSDKKKKIEKSSKFLKLKRVREKGREKEVDGDEEEEDENEKDNFGYTYYTNSSNRMKIDDNYPKNDFTIKLPKSNKKKNKNEIINIKESESSSSGEKYIKCGVRSVPKYNRNKNIINNEVKNKYCKMNNGINSEIKLSKKEKSKNSDLSYHYSFYDNKLYKYRFKQIDNRDDMAKFSCDDPKCLCEAEYNLKNKLFLIKVCHSLDHNEHNYIKKKDSNFSDIFNFMKNKNISDIQLKKQKPSKNIF